jgi:hypothetical protein
MNKDKLWEIYTSRNPSFLKEGATLSAAGLKKFFDQTWNAAHEQGIEIGKVLGAEAERKKPRNDFAEQIRAFMGH